MSDQITKVVKYRVEWINHDGEKVSIDFKNELEAKDFASDEYDIMGNKKKNIRLIGIKKKINA